MASAAPDWILAAAALASAGLYAFFDGRQATLIAILAGWALLPTGEYPAAAIALGKEATAPIHAIALPAGAWFNKATALGLGCLLGTLLYRRDALMRYRPQWIDFAAAVWIVAPILSYVSNGFPILDGIAASLYLAIAWGVPYLLGILFFTDLQGMKSFARAWVIIGVVILPFAFAEFFVGPFWYEIVYGGHPYRFSGSDRSLGHRPMVFVEDGNQFGMLSATTAIAAAGLWTVGERRFSFCRWQVPLGPVAAILTATCLLWQSHGAVIIMIGSLILLWASKWPPRPRRVLVVAMLVVNLILIFAAGFALAFQRLWIRDHLQAAFHNIGKASFTWRLARVEENLQQLSQHPFLGWGVADWSHKSLDGTFTDPIALAFWFHAAGRFGAVGFSASACLLFIPLLRILLSAFWSRRASAADATMIVALMLAANVADLAMNSGLILPMLLAAGGLLRNNMGNQD